MSGYKGYNQFVKEGKKSRPFKEAMRVKKKMIKKMEKEHYT